MAEFPNKQDTVHLTFLVDSSIGVLVLAAFHGFL